MPKKILYLVPSSGIGGAETFIQHTASLHDRHRIEPFYVLFQEGPLLDWFRENQIPGFFLAPFKPRLSNPLSLFKMTLWIRSIMRENKIEAVHSTMAYGAVFGALACLTSRTPHLWFQHGPVTGWLDLLAQALPTTAILTNSLFSIERQQNLSPWYLRPFIPKRKIELLRLGVDMDFISKNFSDESKNRTLVYENNKNWGIEPGAFSAAVFCRLQKQKGVSVFIEAIQKANLLNPNLKIRGLVFAGAQEVSQQTDEEKELRQLAKQRGDFVRFVGNTRAPLGAMLGVDTVVCSSISPESFGLTLVEAMALGKVPIGPKEGGPVEIIDEGQTGLFFEPRNATDLANQLVTLAKDSAGRTQMSQNARKTALEKFNIRDTIRNLESFYDRLL